MVKGDMHSFLVVMSSQIYNNTIPQPSAKDFLVLWLPSVNIWCTNCIAIGTLGIYVL